METKKFITGILLICIFAFSGNVAIADDGGADEVVFAGLLHSALGQANLIYEADNDELLVTNMGTSGNDGVRIYTPENLDYWIGEVDLGYAWQMAPNALFVSSVTGVVGNFAGRLIGNQFVEKISDEQFAYSVDFSPVAPSSLNVFYYHQGQQVYSQNIPGDFYQLETAFGPRGRISIDIKYDSSKPKGDRWEFSFEVEVSVEVSLMSINSGDGGGNTILADAVYVQAVGSELDPDDFSYHDISLNASGIQEFRILSEEFTLDRDVIYGGLPHTPLGQAELYYDEQGDDLIVTHLGSSGDDGVRIVPERDLDYLISDIELVHFADLPQGATMTSSVSGTLNQGQPIPLSTQRVQKLSGEGISYLVDFSYVEPEYLSVYYYLEGNLQRMDNIYADSFEKAMFANIGGRLKLDVKYDSSKPKGDRWTVSFEIEISIGTSSIAKASNDDDIFFDAIFVQAVGSGLDQGDFSYSSIDITTVDIPDFIITGNEYTLRACRGAIPGDLNGDCYVDLLDFAILAENWLACSRADDPDCTWVE